MQIRNNTHKTDSYLQTTITQTKSYEGKDPSLPSHVIITYNEPILPAYLEIAQKIPAKIDLENALAPPCSSSLACSYVKNMILTKPLIILP